MYTHLHVPSAKETSLYIHKYPKFLLLFVTFLIAYMMFLQKDYAPMHEFIIGLGYLGTFLAGCLFTYGFTTSPAIVLLLILGGHQNIYIAPFIAGTGALIGDIFIFGLIRNSLSDEIKKLSHEHAVMEVSRFVPKAARKYALPVIGAIIIASPFPDEIGVALLATSKAMSLKMFIVISYIMNTLGVFTIMLIGSSI